MSKISDRVPAKLWYRSREEQIAVGFFKSDYGRRWKEVALEEWLDKPEWFRKEYPVFKRIRKPTMNREINRRYLVAILCIRRNTYFADFARRRAKRNWLYKEAK